MILHGHPTSIHTAQIRLALHEKYLAFEERTVVAEDNLAALNPFGGLPVLVMTGSNDGDADAPHVTLSEPWTLIEFLEEQHPGPPLMPVEPLARAKVRQLVAWNLHYWPPAWRAFMAPRWGEAHWTESSVQSGRDHLLQHLDVLEAQLPEQGWLLDDFTYAEVVYAPCVIALALAGLIDEVQVRPRLSAWHDALGQRASVKQAMSAYTAA